MENKRPEKWWQTTPLIKDNKFKVIGLDQWGEETVEWFTLEELAAHLTKYAPDMAPVTSAEPDSGLESVPAVESDTQPRG